MNIWTEFLETFNSLIWQLDNIGFNHVDGSSEGKYRVIIGWNDTLEAEWDHTMINDGDSIEEALMASLKAWREKNKN